MHKHNVHNISNDIIKNKLDKPGPKQHVIFDVIELNHFHHIKINDKIYQSSFEPVTPVGDYRDIGGGGGGHIPAQIKEYLCCNFLLC